MKNDVRIAEKETSMKKSKTINKCKGWKVLLKKNRRSISDWDNLNIHSIRYPVNVEVFPSLKGSKLFFFKSEKDAKNYIGRLGRYNGVEYITVKCIATNPKKQPFITNSLTQLTYFWDYVNKTKGASVPFTENAPHGTYVADSITCLR